MYRNGGAWKRLAATAVGCGALVVAGCGGSSAESDGPTVDLRVTERFGHELLAGEDRAPLEGRRTMLRLLKDHHDVKASPEGYAIEAIDGRRRRPEPEDHETVWVANVNGVETDIAASDYRLYDGDVVQLDLRDWYTTLDVRATVGAFPETFSRGVFGKRFPTVVECERPASQACRHVKRLLRRAGVATDGSGPPSGGLPPRGEPQRAKLLVGTWRHLRGHAWASRIDRGPRYSGVFARFAPDARSMRVLDWEAHRVRSEGAGAGLVGAQRPTEEDLLWVVTGVDNEGVERAAKALGSAALRDAFAAAVTADGVQKLPLAPPTRR